VTSVQLKAECLQASAAKPHATRSMRKQIDATKWISTNLTEVAEKLIQWVTRISCSVKSFNIQNGLKDALCHRFSKLLYNNIMGQPKIIVSLNWMRHSCWRAVLTMKVRQCHKKGHKTRQMDWTLVRRLVQKKGAQRTGPELLSRYQNKFITANTALENVAQFQYLETTATNQN
jgi:hypothetical protein